MLPGGEAQKNFPRQQKVPPPLHKGSRITTLLIYLYTCNPVYLCKMYLHQNMKKSFHPPLVWSNIYATSPQGLKSEHSFKYHDTVN